MVTSPSEIVTSSSTKQVCGGHLPVSPAVHALLSTFHACAQPSFTSGLLYIPCLAVATSAEHVRLAREVASASVVLLKNDNDVLPIQRGARVALIGAACDAAFLNANEGRWDAADYYSIGGSARVLSDPAAAMSITRALTERHANSDLGGLTVLPLDDVQVALDGMRGHDIAIVVRDCVAIH